MRVAPSSLNQKALPSMGEDFANCFSANGTNKKPSVR